MNVLVIAPHPDDEILGCGGTIAKHVANDDDVYVCIVTRGYPPVYNHPREVLDNLQHDLFDEIQAAHKLLNVKKTFYLQMPAVMMETVPRYELNGKVSGLIKEVEPNVIYIPHFGDMQKDHAITSEAVMVAVRPKFEYNVQYVYAYETLSETEWNIPHAANAFMPNVFIDISDYLGIKLEAMACYKSQISLSPNPRSLEAVQALAKFRGSTMGTRAAEAFTLIREYRE